MRTIPQVSGRQPAPYAVGNGGFHIENGPQRYNRALYGAVKNGSRFSVFAGDVPEWMLYQSGGAGYVFIGVVTDGDFVSVASFRTYDLWYGGGREISSASDPVYGNMEIQPLPGMDSACMVLQVSNVQLPANGRLCVVYGGIDRMGDHRNLDAGYTPQEKTLFHPGRAAGNTVNAADRTVTVSCQDIQAVLEADVPCNPAVISAAGLVQGKLLSAGENDCLAALLVDGDMEQLLIRVSLDTPCESLQATWEKAVQHVNGLAERVQCTSSDEALDAAVGCLPAALEGMWVAPYYMHGAWSWRIPLLGWRSRFGATLLGWGNRVKEEVRAYFAMMYRDGDVIRRKQADAFDKTYFAHASAQEQTPVAAMDAPGQPDPNYRYARQGTGSVFNSDGAMPYGPSKQGIPQYDMQEDFITQVIYQLNAGRDDGFAAEVFPLLRRHLAWQDRCFDADHDGLYENFANYWASDSMQYSGAGCALATANNYLAYTAAAQLAEMLHEDAEPYRDKAEAIRRAFHDRLWLKDEQHPAECVDVMGNRLVHPQAILPTIVTCITSGILTEEECLSSLDYVRNQLEHVHLPDGELVYNSQFAPYRWSVRDVDFADVCHLALCCFLMNRADDGWRYLRGVIGESCMRMVAPGAFMCVLEGKSIDFSDTTSMFARAVIEGLFGYRPQLLDGVIELAPAITAALPELSWRIPGAQANWTRTEDTLRFTWSLDEPAARLRIRLPMHRQQLDAVRMDGADTNAYRIVSMAGMPCAEIMLAESTGGEIELRLSGEAAECSIPRVPARNKPVPELLPVPSGACWQPLNIDGGLCHRVTDLFSKPYLSPRPASCSLQLPWSLLPPSWCIGAGGENMTQDFDFTLSDQVLRGAVRDGVFMACGIPFRQSADGNNVTFVSQWDNFPASAVIPLHAPAGKVALLITGCTNHMQCGVPNTRLHFVHKDGSETCFELSAPVSFRSIESGPENERPQDRSCYQVDLPRTVIGRFDGRISGNAYAQVNVFELPADAKALHVEAVANEIVFGVMAVSVNKIE